MEKFHIKPSAKYWTPWWVANRLPGGLKSQTKQVLAEKRRGEER